MLEWEASIDRLSLEIEEAGEEARMEGENKLPQSSAIRL